MAAKSEKLDSYLESHQTESVKEKLAGLKALGIDPEVFAKFHDKIEGILEKYDVDEDYVIDSLSSNMKLQDDLARISNNYTRSFRSILDASSNNQDYNGPDESLVS